MRVLTARVRVSRIVPSAAISRPTAIGAPERVAEAHCSRRTRGSTLVAANPVPTSNRSRSPSPAGTLRASNACSANPTLNSTEAATAAVRPIASREPVWKASCR